MDKAFGKALDKALAALRCPDAKLVRQHGGTLADNTIRLGATRHV
jgi:hypothetical protein